MGAAGIPDSAMVCIGAAGNLWTRQDTDDDESNLTTLAVGCQRVTEAIQYHS